ncbi:MAG: NUDIX domain-containing protein [Rhodobacteraceae bacterium]|nr:NUDIX domain-containing protein [Paracoccaceae bacterium]
MPQLAPRVIVIGVLVHNQRLLAMRVSDPQGRLIGARPLGGGVDFGETSSAALIREFREEIGADVIVSTESAMFENLFQYNGAQKHEIVVARPVRLREAALLEQERFEINEGDGVVFTAEWFALEDLRLGRPPLFPPGLLDVVESWV